MADEEKGEVGALEYLDYIDKELLERRAGKRAEFDETIANIPGLDFVYGRLQNPFKGIGYIRALADKAKGNELDPNAPYFDISRSQQNIAGISGDNLAKFVSGEKDGKEATDFAKFAGESAKFLYNTGASIADFLITAGLTGGTFGAGTALLQQHPKDSRSHKGRQ